MDKQLKMMKNEILCHKTWGISSNYQNKHFGLNTGIKIAIESKTFNVKENGHLKLQSAINSIKQNEIMNYLLKMLITMHSIRAKGLAKHHERVWKYFENSQFTQIRFMA